MIVCDECRDVNVKGFDCAIVIEKQDEYKATAENRRRVKRKPREVCKIPVVLCEKCLSKVLKNLGHLKAAGQLSGYKPPEQPKEEGSHDRLPE